MFCINIKDDFPFVDGMFWMKVLNSNGSKWYKCKIIVGRSSNLELGSKTTWTVVYEDTKLVYFISYLNFNLKKRETY